jgi:hypothetical protein
MEEVVSETKIVVKQQEVSFDITELVKASIQADKFAANLEIMNEKDLILAVEGMAEIKGKIKDGEETRKKVIDSPNKYVKTVNGYFKQPIETLEAAIKKINTKIQFFRDAERQLIEERQAAERDAFNKRQEEEKLNAAREQRTERMVAPPKIIEDKASTFRTPTAKATFIEFWDYEIADLAELYKARPDLVKLEPKRKEILAALKITQNIPGLVAVKSSTTRQ